MIPFRGNITGSVDSVAGDLPLLIESFGLVNKTAGTVGVNVYLINGAAQIAIMPLNKQINSGEMYEGTRNIVLLATQKIRVQSSGSLDYDFTLSNLTP